MQRMKPDLGTYEEPGIVKQLGSGTRQWIEFARVNKVALDKDFEIERVLEDDLTLEDERQ
jgi:hypothetical protein